MAPADAEAALLDYSEWGEGPALVLLHAFPLDRSLWRDVTESLAARGWRVITPDLTGFGATGGAATTIDDMASDVAALLDALSVHSAVIGGCSMGGYVALSFAEQYPKRAAGLILIDTKANADGEEARANRERIASQVQTSHSTEALAVTQPDAMLSDATRKAKPDVVAWLQATIRAQQADGVAAAQRAMAQRSEQFEMLASLHVPVLCIRGADDAIASADDQARMAEAAVESVAVTVPDAGHLVPIEQPEAFVEQVGAFLDRILAPKC